jgi:hypothetical protein
MDKSYLHTKIAVAGGSFASLVPNLGTEDFLTSGILAVFGASVSFIVSVFLKRCFRKSKFGRRWFKRKSKGTKK